MKKCGSIALMISIGLNTIHAQEISPSAYEIAPVFRSSEILPEELLIGPYHRVREQAPSDGYLTVFTIDTAFGVYPCMGRRELERFIGELGALATLSTVSKSDLFAEGLKRSVEAPIDAVKNIVTNPKESLRQAPETVGHFFKKAGGALHRGVDKVGRKITEEDKAPADERLVETGRGIGTAAKNLAGFQKAKLDTARQLGIDPYSDFLQLQDEMEKVTWAFFAGGMPLRIAAIAASGGASVALTATTTVGLPEEIYDITPSELALRDEETLKKMGVPEAAIRNLILSETWSTSRRYRLVRSLSALPLSGEAPAAVVNAALTCASSRQAEFLTLILEGLVAHHQKNPLSRIACFERAVCGITAEGVTVFVAPVDFVSWTESVAAFANRDDLPEGAKSLVLSSGISPVAKRGFEAAGWTVATP